MHPVTMISRRPFASLFDLVMPMTRRAFCPVALVVLVSANAACAETAATAADKAPDPLLTLPVLPKPEIATIEPLARGEPLPGVAGVRYVLGERVALDGSTNIDHGPVDGLEVLACLKDGKTHEALVRLDTTTGQWVKFACIRALGLESDGMPTAEGSGVPARGTPVRLRLAWKDEDGKTRIVDASCLVRDRVMDRAYPPLPFVYTGSRFQVIQEQGPDGTTKRKERFMLDSTRSIAVNFDEPDALLASPFPGASDDARFEANSALVPSAGTVIELVIEKAQLPFTLDMDETGALSYEGRPRHEALNDPALGEVLAAHYGAGLPPDALRAVGVKVRRSVDRSLDVAARARVLAAAAAAKVWVVPVFVLAGE